MGQLDNRRRTRAATRAKAAQTQVRTATARRRSATGSPRTAPEKYLRRNTQRRRALPLLAAGAVLVVAAVVAVLGASGTAFGSSGAEPVASTPRDEWRTGEVPFLYQTDPAWAAEPYAGGTVGENGCGPTCLSMVYVALTGKTNLDPAQMAAFSEQEGHVSGNMTAWTLMSEGAERLGLTSEELPADAGRVRAALASGAYVICSMRPGDFTTTGHFIVLAGTVDTGELVVHDPNSYERSAQTWDINRVLEQCANLWAISA